MKPSAKLHPAKFETAWQKRWEKERVYQPDLYKAKKPYYNLMMFPYPSAEGLHVGNVYAFTGADINGRFKRMQGNDVFEPIGLDGFGIHSENYAIKIGKHPAQQAKVSQKNFYRQLHAIGGGFAWENTLETYDPDYYKWTQWIFVQMFKHGLAYRKKSQVNFCPSCKTVLSDEQVVNRIQNSEFRIQSVGESRGVAVCERCSTPVEKRQMQQWFFRITDYAERLLQNTYKESFQWTQKVKTGQRNWIGKKEGINITYPLLDETGHPLTINPPAGGQPSTIVCFTTRPDTNFGATFVVIGPEHPLVEDILSGKIDGEKSLRPDLHAQRIKEIREYVEKAKATSEMERIAAGRKKTGVATGLFAVNQLNDYKMPVYVSDFVLGNVGTGAVIGVPGHDLRDFEFAKEFKLPILRVVVGSDGDASDITASEQVQEEEGQMVNSGLLDGKDIKDAIPLMMDHLEKKGWGKKVTTYKLRDWCISRQRYWGAPIPMLFCKQCASKGKSWFDTPEASSALGNSKFKIQNSKLNENSKLEIKNSDAETAGWYPVPESDLPVKLPPMDDWQPEGTGKGPLAKVKSFIETKCPHCGSNAERESDVCDTFLDSSWYFLRYPSVSDVIPSVVEGSLAHASSNKSRDSSQASPVRNDNKLPWDPQITSRWLPVTQYIGGAEHTVLHLLYARFVWMCFYDWGLLEFDEPFSKFYAHGLIIAQGAKMSKSRGNVVVPDEYIAKYGADTLRTYLMFLGPFDQGGDFRDTGIAGMYRFLSRVWRLVNQYLEPGSDKDTSDGGPDSIGDSSEVEGSVNLMRFMHKTIKAVSEDLESFRYNTAIAHIMEYINEISNINPPAGGQISNIPKEVIETLLLLLAPFAPHMTEELWQKLGGDTFQSIHLHPWPSFDPKYLQKDTVTIVVQINGKVRDTLVINHQSSTIQNEVEHLATQSEKVTKYLEGVSTRKVIFISGKLINFVV